MTIVTTDIGTKLIVLPSKNGGVEYYQLNGEKYEGSCENLELYCCESVGEGLSAYEVAVENGFTGTESEWLDSLQGADGVDGSNGLSAYQIWLNAGNTGTEQDFIDSLQGSNGVDGVTPQPIWDGTELSWDLDNDGIGDTTPVDLSSTLSFQCSDVLDCLPDPPTEVNGDIYLAGGGDGLLNTSTSHSMGSNASLFNNVCNSSPFDSNNLGGTNIGAEIDNADFHVNNGTFTVDNGATLEVSPPGLWLTFYTNGIHNITWTSNDGTQTATLQILVDCDIADSDALSSVQAGTNITIDNTDPKNPIINATGDGGTGDNWGTQVVEIAATPAVNTGLVLRGDGTSGNPLAIDETNFIGVLNIVAGTNIIVDDTDPNNPIISASGVGGGDDWGTQVAQVNSPLLGDGTSGNPLDIDFSQINAEDLSDIPAYPNDGGNYVLEENNGVLTWISTPSGGGTGDNWGTQVVETDGTLTGDGTTGNELSVNESALSISRSQITDREVYMTASLDNFGASGNAGRYGKGVIHIPANSTIEDIIVSCSVVNNDPNMTVTYSLIGGGSLTGSFGVPSGQYTVTETVSGAVGASNETLVFQVDDGSNNALVGNLAGNLESIQITVRITL